MRGRNATQGAQINNEEFRLLSSKPMVMWVFFHGYVSRTEVATGYNPAQHEGWCIPLQLWRKKSTMSAESWMTKAMNDARKIRVIDTGVVLQNYSDPETNKWWILAQAERPVYGIPVRMQPNNREGLIAVPASTKDPGGDMQRRVAALKQDDDSAKDYPAVDEVWVATIRIQPDGTVKIYPKGVDEATPLLSLNKQITQIKTSSTKFDHDPDQMIFGQHQTSPSSKDIPSTNTIPVQTFIPISSDFLMVAAIAIATAQYINKEGLKSSNSAFGSVGLAVPTQFQDYASLKKV